MRMSGQKVEIYENHKRFEDWRIRQTVFASEFVAQNLAHLNPGCGLEIVRGR